MTIRKRIRIPIEKSQDTEFVSFTFPGHDKEDVAILFKGWDKDATPTVRIHSECLTGDIFHSQRCDCHAQLHEAIDLFSANGGILIYLRQEGRNIGLYNKLDAYDLQINHGMDTFTANTKLGFSEDARNYDVAAMMLKDLGIKKIRLLTNNPDKKKGLINEGIDVVEIIPTGKHVTEDNSSYLNSKREKGHLFAA